MPNVKNLKYKNLQNFRLGYKDEINIRSVWLSSQPLPESMVARLRESKKVCGAADTQLQVYHYSVYITYIKTKL